MDNESIFAGSDFNLRYYDEINGEKSIVIKLRFLTPALRVKISNLNEDAQKKLKPIQKKYKKFLDINADIERRADDYQKNNPEASQFELDSFKQKLNAEKFGELSDKEKEEVFVMQKEVEAVEQEKLFDFFSLIINKAQIEKEAKDLLNTEYKSDFWQNVDLRQINSVTNFFRKEYQLGK